MLITTPVHARMVTGTCLNRNIPFFFFLFFFHHSYSSYLTVVPRAMFSYTASNYCHRVLKSHIVGKFAKIVNGVHTNTKGKKKMWERGRLVRKKKKQKWIPHSRPRFFIIIFLEISKQSLSFYFNCFLSYLGYFIICSFLFQWFVAYTYKMQYFFISIFGYAN